MNLVFSGVVVCVAFAGVVLGENIHDLICREEFKGYTVDYATRRCVQGTARGCVDPFPYKTHDECTRDFRGKGLCDSSRCLNGGICMSITNRHGKRKLKCDCYMTGFFGKRCHRKCPEVLTRTIQESCIQI